jgi:transglutaminase-like putative cysteine protease
VVDNIEYDSAKVYNLMYDYLPDIEKTYLEKTGICYDYASLFAAMLRSIGIPAKLVKGYSKENPDVYHAWNEVLLNGKWIVVDTTLDASNPRSNEKMAKAVSDYLKVYEY